MRPVKLLKFVAIFAIGGTERQFVDLALALEPSRFAVHFGCLRRWGQLLQPIESRGIPIFDYQVFTFRDFKAARAQWQLARDIRRHGIQIVHTYNFDANLFAIPAAKLAGARVLASIRDMGAHLTPLQRVAQRLVCRLADRIVVNAKAIKERLVRDGCAEERITVIPNGLEIGRFQQTQQTGILHKTFGFHAGAPLIGVVGRVAPLKGIENFLRAAAIVAERHPSSRFVVIGDEVFALRGEVVERDGGYTRHLKELTVQLGLENRVVFTGYEPNVERLLPELAVSVQPSMSEGLSNTLLESMAAGVPVVATRVGDAAEVIEDEQSGLLVAAGDSEALARAICRLLETPALANDLAMSARRATQRFSMTRLVESTSSLYDALLQTRAAAAF